MRDSTSGELASAQLQFLYDQLEFPDNSWVSIAKRVPTGAHLTERQARNLVGSLALRWEALRSRIVTDRDGTFRQEVVGLEEFFATSFRYTRSDVPVDAPDLPVTSVDGFVQSTVFAVVAEPAGATFYYLAHHSFFDASATQILSAEIMRAAGDPRALDAPGPLTADGGAEIQPRHIKAYEDQPRGLRATRTWLDFHQRVISTPWEHCVPDPSGRNTENKVSFALGPKTAGRLHDVATSLSVSVPAMINSLVCGYVGMEFGLPHVTLKTICANRFAPALRTSVSSLATETWIDRGTAGADSPEWHRSFFGALLNSYRHGIYDWDRVRTSPNFHSPFRSRETVSTNIAYWDDVEPEPAADSAPVLEVHEALTVPRSLGHDLAVFAGIGADDVRISVKTARHCADEAATVELAGGLHAYVIRQLDAF
ncbi:hypothetical protein [Streptomyces sp. NPDC056452]|uniref:hypothetical protein n=1 Tax=Streptomyces sp. NPDC056452 TaxID=3345821 RepID=UPI00369C19A2